MNHKLFTAVISTALTLIPGVARADWINVSNLSEVQSLIDNSAIERRGDTVFYWEHDILAVPLKGSIKSITSYQSVNCQTRITRTHRLIGYNVAGKVIADGNLTEKQLPPTTVVPGTNGDSVYKAVCYNY